MKEEEKLPKLLTSAEAGDVDALKEVTSILLKGKSEKNLRKLYSLLTKHADKDAELLHSLAMMLQNGDGCEKDEVAAIKKLNAAASKGSSQAKFVLGKMYRYGVSGVEADTSKAEKLLRESSNGGVAEAQYELAVIYESGIDFRADVKEALRWYEKSANSGFAKAQFVMGKYYANGYSQPDFVLNPNLDKAIEFWKLAAENDYKEAQFELATAYVQNAINWYEASAPYNDKSKIRVDYLRGLSE